MANLNRVMLIGRLTRDPESRHTANGNSVTNFGLAVNRTYKRPGSDDTVEETTFVDVEAWGKTGETFARYMKKGRQAYVEGRLRLDSWEKDGQKRSKIVVVMESFQFLDSGSSSGSGAAGDRGTGGEMAGNAPRRAPAGMPARAPANAESGGGAPPSDATPQDDYKSFDDDIPF